MERGGSNERPERKPAERTKSILKQSSKEGSSGGEVGSPRKEVVMFVDGLDDKKEKNKVDLNLSFYLLTKEWGQEKKCFLIGTL